MGFTGVRETLRKVGRSEKVVKSVNSVRRVKRRETKKDRTLWFTPRISDVE